MRWYDDTKMVAGLRWTHKAQNRESSKKKGKPMPNIGRNNANKKYFSLGGGHFPLQLVQTMTSSD